VQQGLPAILLSIAVIAALLLFAGGVRTVARGERKQGLLMIGAALVTLGNVLIWIWPLPAT
jgi:hypothetical protein